MFDANWGQTLDTFRREIASITEQAGILSKKFTEVCKETESFKVAFLNHCLERQRRYLAGCRGIASVIENKKGLGKSLAMGAAGFVIGAIISQDNFVGVREGLEGFDTGLRDLGETSWIVCIGKDLRILPCGDVATMFSEKLVTWESFKRGLAQLEEEALKGVELGDLDNIVSRLKKGGELIYLEAAQYKVVTERTKDF